MIFSFFTWDNVYADHIKKHYIKDYDIIVNCIANTDTYTDDYDEHFDVNYLFVAHLSEACRDLNKKLVQISTDYVYANSKQNSSETDVPVHDGNWYTYTKVISEPYVELRLDNYVIIRATHKPRPFLFEKGLISQVGNFDYIDVVSKIYIDLIEGDAQGIYNVGTELKTMYDLAKRTRDDVVPTNVKFHDSMPLDVSMDLTKLGEVYDKK